jgi:hypothetical protein
MHGVYGQTTILDCIFHLVNICSLLSVHYDHISDNALFLLS